MTFAEAAAEPRQDQPPVIGMAALVGLAYRQGNLGEVWNWLLERFAADPTDAAALMDLSVILQATGQREKGLELQQKALQLRRYYRRMHGRGNGLEVLALVTGGDFMANTPIDFLMEGSDAILSMLYVDGLTPHLRDVPRHDVAFIAVGESEANITVLENLERLLESWQGPIMNADPRRIMALKRDTVAAMFTDEPSIVAPATVRVDRSSLHLLAQGHISLATLLPDENFPLIARPLDSHAGEGLEKVDGLGELGAYLGRRPEQQFYLAPFVGYSGPDGLFRKQRIALIDGQAFPGHWAVSKNWMVHYLNSGMQENEAWRAEEEAWMRDFDTDFAIRHAHAFDALHRKIALDYFVIDCAETQDGRLLLFEAQIAMIVHAMDPSGMFPYKRPAMLKLFSAFQAALQRRCAPSLKDTGFL